jgi:hypothetical protein
VDFYLQGSNLWFLVAKPRVGSEVEDLQFQLNGRNPKLVCFTVGEKQPVAFPVTFDIKGVGSGGVFDFISVPPWIGQWKFQWTPEGMALTAKGMPGFWLIPPDDLQKAVQNAKSWP